MIWISSSAEFLCMAGVPMACDGGRQVAQFAPIRESALGWNYLREGLGAGRVENCLRATRAEVHSFHLQELRPRSGWR